MEILDKETKELLKYKEFIVAIHELMDDNNKISKIFVKIEDKIIELRRIE